MYTKKKALNLDIRVFSIISNKMMMYSKRWDVFFLLLLAFHQVDAEQRRRFPSYQPETADVLRSINSDEYEKLYVHYHGCVWSEFNSDNDNGAGCAAGDGGGADDENAQWYVGQTQCYRSNVVYSLYGIRADERKNKKRPNNPCQRRYYINSFFTNNGLEDFGAALGLKYSGDASSSCTALEDNNADGNNNGNGDGSSSYQHNSLVYPNSKSYTTYCDAKGKFVTALFGGTYCTDTKELELMDTLDALNNELDNVGCLLVYSAQANANNGEENNAEQEAGRRRLEENEEGGLWDLVGHSSICSTLEYPHGCPDPYGVKKSFDLNPTTSTGFWKQMTWLDWTTASFLFLALILMVMSCWLDKRNRKMKSKNSGGTNKSKRFRRSGTRKRVANEQEQNQPQVEETKSQTNENTPKKKGFFRGFFSRRSQN
jgi:hypothetical protein